MDIYEKKFKDFIREEALTDPLKIKGDYTARDGSIHKFEFDIEDMRDTHLEIDNTFDIESMFDKYEGIEKGKVVGPNDSRSINAYRKKSKYKDFLDVLIPAISEKTGMSEEYINSVHVKHLVSDIRKSATLTPEGRLAWKLFLNNYDEVENTDDIELKRVEFLLNNASPEGDFGIYMFEIDGDVAYIGVANKGSEGKYGFKTVGGEYNRKKNSTSMTKTFGSQGGDTRDKVNKKLADYIIKKGKDNVVIDWYNLPINAEKARKMLKDIPESDIDFTRDSKKSNKGGPISYLEFIESALIKRFDTLNHPIKMQTKGEITDRFKIN